MRPSNPWSRWPPESEPFLLSVGFLDSHFPFAPPAPWCDMYDPTDVVMPSRARDEMPGKPPDSTC